MLLHLDDDHAPGARVAELVQHARPDLLYRRRPPSDSAFATLTTSCSCPRLLRAGTAETDDG
jgi:hypothetical protein